MTPARSRTDLKLDYVNRRSAIRLVADFASHWDLRENTYGYRSVRQKLPYKADSNFYCQLSLVVSPKSVSKSVLAPPDLYFKEDVGGFSFEIDSGRITAIVPLNRPELWGTVKGSTTPLLYVDRSRQNKSLCEWKPGVFLDLRIWISTLAEQVPIPDQYEEGQPNMLPGGQFESNRRKH